MTLKRKTIELVEVGPEFCLDTLYANDAYNEQFVIEDKWGNVHSVTLHWFQGGYGNNFQFLRESDDADTGISPSDVAYIEVR